MPALTDSDAGGVENSGSAMGALPYLSLQITPSDAYRRNLRSDGAHKW